MVRHFSCAAVVICIVGIVLGAGPQDKYDAAAKRASRAYYMAMVAADRQLVADLKVASNLDVSAQAQLDAAQRKLDYDLSSLKEGRLLQDAGQPPAPVDDQATPSLGDNPSLAENVEAMKKDAERLDAEDEQFKSEAAYGKIELKKTTEAEALVALERERWHLDSLPHTSDYVRDGESRHMVTHNFRKGHAHRLTITSVNGIVTSKSIE